MGMFNVRCGLTRIPFDPQDRVQVIRMQRDPIGFQEILSVDTGLIDEYGCVYKDGEEIANFNTAMLVSAAAAQSLSEGRFFEPFRTQMQATLADIKADLEKARCEENHVIVRMMAMTAQAKSGLHFGVLAMDKDTPKAEVISRMELMVHTLEVAGWLVYAEDLFDIQIQTSANDYTHMSKANHLRYQSGMQVAMRAEHDRLHTPDPMAGMF